MQPKTLVLLGAVAGFLAAPAARAEETTLNYDPLPSPNIHKHDGFYFNAALGGGYTTGRVEEDPEPEGGGDLRVRGGAAASQLLFGGTPTRGLVVGGGTIGTLLPRGRLKSGGHVVSKNILTVTSLGPFVTFYPNAREGFHVMGHLGLAELDYERDDIDDKDWSFGYALTVALGYDWWIAEQWSLGALGRLQYAKTAANVEDPPDVPETTIVHEPLSAAALVSLTYH